MAHLVEKQGRAWVRLDRLTHNALAEVYAEMPHGCVASTSQYAKAAPLLTHWKLARIKLSDSRINDGRPPENVFELTSFGLAWAKCLPPISTDRRTLPPLFPLADVLAELPQPFIDWLSEDPPIRKLEGGIMLDVMGVLIPTIRGDGYIPSDALKLAFAELAQRKQGGRSFTPECMVNVELDPVIADFLTKTTIGPGVPWNGAVIDGRQLRPYAMTDDGAGWVTLTDDKFYRCSYEMRGLVSAFASGERDGFRLARLLPKRFQEWLALGIPDALAPAKHGRVLAVLGLARRKGKYDWRLTRQGEAVVPLLASALRSDEGVEAVDDATYDGDGVDIMLPDENGPSDLDLAFGCWPDGSPLDGPNPWDILGGPQIVEAPVPSNADLAAAGARRRGADLSLDTSFDEFDIL